jgi:hypothetical protein
MEANSRVGSDRASKRQNFGRFFQNVFFFQNTMEAPTEGANLLGQMTKKACDHPDVRRDPVVIWRSSGGAERLS